jgi:hypothetical protein
MTRPSGLVLGVTRRERVIAETVTVANLTIPTVDEEFKPFITGNVPARRNRIRLGGVYG